MFRIATTPRTVKVTQAADTIRKYPLPNVSSRGATSEAPAEKYNKADVIRPAHDADADTALANAESCRQRNAARQDVEGKNPRDVFIGVQDLHGEAVAQRDGHDSGLDQEDDSQPRRGNRNYPPKQYLGTDACRRPGSSPVLQESAKKM
jgi:hypothetical protein